MIDLLRALLEHIDHRDAKVVIIGQGYVGLPVAIRAAELGFRVVR
jgi:UDP-N-acetyl-D-mannosaminuronate dehydrogenase